MVAFVPDVVSNRKDKNISLIASWNIVGYSHNESLNVSDLKFTPDGESTLTWSQAVSQGKVQAYLTYRENDRYKYAASSNLKMDDYALRPGKAYWVRANVAGNLTLPGVGTNTGLSGDYDSIKLEKVGSTKYITNVNTDGSDWVFDDSGSADYIQEYGDYSWYNICETLVCPRKNVSTWKGIWIWGNNEVNMTADI